MTVLKIANIFIASLYSGGGSGTISVETIKFPFEVTGESSVIATDNDGSNPPRSGNVSCSWLKNNRITFSGFSWGYTAIIMGRCKK